MTLDHDPLWSELDGLQRRIGLHQIEDVKARWEFGKRLRDWHERNDSLGEYGDKIAVKAAERYHIDVSEVYRRVAFVKMLPTEQALAKLLDNPTNWTHIIRKVLPSVAKSPDSVGGPERQVDKVVGIGESAAMLAEDLVNHAPADDALRKEAAAGLVLVGSRLIEAGQSLSQDVDMEIPHIPQSPTVSPEDAAPGQINTLQHFYRTTQRCVICGKEPTLDDRMQFHHWPSTKGAGGKDWQGVSVCPGECHKWAQENPDEFMEAYMGGILYAKDRLIFELLMQVSGAGSATR